MIAVENVKPGHHFADIIAGDCIAVLFAVLFQLSGAVDFIVVIVKVCTGVHSAFDNLQRLMRVMLMARRKNKNLICDKPVVCKVFFCNSRTDVIGVDLLKIIFFQSPMKAPFQSSAYRCCKNWRSMACPIYSADRCIPATSSP